MVPAALDSPYKGLVPYAEEDADLFFGREAEREIIAANLLANRLTLLYGPSGVGKSSVLQAGVVHDLREQARDRIERHRHVDAVPVVVRSWADDPAVALLAETRRALQDLLGDRAADLPVPRDGLTATLEAWTKALDVELLLVLDQFEEYFTYGLGRGRHLFADEIAQLVGAPQLHVRVLISIREDALARLDAFKGRIPGLFDNYLRIEHLTLDAARAAIVRPVERFDELTGVPAAERRSVDPDLVEAVIAQVRSGEVGLGRAAGGSPSGHGAGGHVETPYLQLVMDRLWRTEAERGSRVLRRASLFQIGGAEEIVRTHVASAMSALEAADQDIAAAAFHYLVTPSGLKMAHSADDLAGYTGAPADRLAPLLERLCSSPIRILRPQPVPDRPDAPPRWEIVHDVLAHAVLEWGREREHEREAAERAEAARQQERARHRRRIRRLVAAGVVLVLLPAAFGVQAEEARVESIKREGIRTELVDTYEVSVPRSWKSLGQRSGGRRTTRVTFVHEAGDESRLVIDRYLRTDASGSMRARQAFARRIARVWDAKPPRPVASSLAGRVATTAAGKDADGARVLILTRNFVLEAMGREADLDMLREVASSAAASLDTVRNDVLLAVVKDDGLALTPVLHVRRGKRWPELRVRFTNGSNYPVVFGKAKAASTAGGKQRPQLRVDETECRLKVLRPRTSCDLVLRGRGAPVSTVSFTAEAVIETGTANARQGVYVAPVLEVAVRTAPRRRTGRLKRKLPREWAEDLKALPAERTAPPRQGSKSQGRRSQGEPTDEDDDGAATADQVEEVIEQVPETVAPEEEAPGSEPVQQPAPQDDDAAATEPPPSRPMESTPPS